MSKPNKSRSAKATRKEAKAAVQELKALQQECLSLLADPAYQAMFGELEKTAAPPTKKRLGRKGQAAQ